MKAALLALAALSLAQTARAACADLDPAGLEALAKARGAPLEIVFFASWCSACKEHLTASHAPGTLLLGVFDKKDRIEAVVDALKPVAPCYFDKGVADALGVQSLPLTKKYISRLTP